MDNGNPVLLLHSQNYNSHGAVHFFTVPLPLSSTELLEEGSAAPKEK